MRTRVRNNIGNIKLDALACVCHPMRDRELFRRFPDRYPGMYRGEKVGPLLQSCRRPNSRGCPLTSKHSCGSLTFTHTCMTHKLQIHKQNPFRHPTEYFNEMSLKTLNYWEATKAFPTANFSHWEPQKTHLYPFWLQLCFIKWTNY